MTTNLMTAPSPLFDAVLFENGGQVALGDIVLEGAIAEDRRGIADRSLVLTPGDHAQRQCFHVCRLDAFDQACH